MFQRCAWLPVHTGVHCNVNRLTISPGVTISVIGYDGTKGGSFEVYAEVISVTLGFTVGGLKPVPFNNNNNERISRAPFHVKHA